MYQTLYPIFDSTIDSQFPDRNEGMDQILTIRKATAGEPSIEGETDVYFDTNYNSRILLKFDLTAVSKSIASGKISSDNQFFLRLSAANSLNLPVEYTLWTYAASGSWVNGAGFTNSNPKKTNGVSWFYRDSKAIGTRWASGSYNPNSTGSYSTVVGGGNWFTNVSASQTFKFENPEVRMNVTGIVRSWISGSIPNEGFVVKLHDSDEADLSSFGMIQFFSVNSHTIYVPRLEVYWKDTDFSGTSSISQIGSDDFVLSFKNIRELYSDIEKPKVRLHVRDRYPIATYTTSSNYLTTKRLPINSYYQIQDVITDEVIVPFHPSGTLINCDSDGNYFKFDCESLMPERMYKFVIKSEFESGDVVRIVDDNFNFKIGRH